MKSITTVGKAYSDSQMMVGKDAIQPSAKASVVVKVVRKILRPTSSIVS